jgi:hypothetical protein
VIVQRRQRLARRIDKQIELLKNAQGGLLPPNCWAWIDDKEKLLLPVRYGTNSIELQNGKAAIECDDLEMVAKGLETIRQMVLSGDIDGSIAQPGVAIRARFT